MLHTAMRVAKVGRTLAALFDLSTEKSCWTNLESREEPAARGGLTTLSVNNIPSGFTDPDGGPATRHGNKLR